MTGPLVGMRLLEPGCGTGRLTELLAIEAGMLAYVVAVDIKSSHGCPCLHETYRLR
jgi:ubiquinone/menaquinone biosynthesis C-methylase UbiE